MKNGLCPKCNSTNVFMKNNGIWLGGHTLPLTIFPGSIGSGANCESYVCVDCGYFENYVVTKELLEEIRQKWNKVA